MEELIFAVKYEDGKPFQTSASNMVPEGFNEVTQEEYMEALAQIENVEAELPSIPLITYKADVWRRVTDEQADELDQEIAKLGVRERNLWSDSMYLSHDDELFDMLYNTMLEAWGKAETDRVLAPSN